MPVDTRHPEYAARQDEWQMARDTIVGPRAVEAAGPTYLPVPPGMMDGFAGGGDALAAKSWPTGSRYALYRSFAEFPDIVGPTVRAILGLIHERPPDVTLPERLAYLEESATANGQTLHELWRRTTREILSVGRVAHLADVVTDAAGNDGRWAVCWYSGESLINWRQGDDGLAFAVLTEGGEAAGRDEFEVVPTTRFRELRILDGTYVTRVWVKGEGDKLAPLTDESTDAEGWVVPQMQGSRLAAIPLSVINSDGVGIGFGPVPIAPLSRRALAIYRQSAAYRRALWNKAEPQAVITGMGENEPGAPTTIGGGTIWFLGNSEADAKYLDIDGQGIPLMRQDIEDEYHRAAREAGKMLETSDGAQAESGEAIRRRLSTQQVTLKDLAIQAGNGMEMSLRLLGTLSGMTEEQTKDEIHFEPNLDFAAAEMTARELMELVSAKNLGAPLANRTIHDLMVKRGMTTMSYDEEIAEAADDSPGAMMPVEPGSGV